MFVRIAEKRVKESLYQYVRIVESYREDGKTKQRVVANLGNLERLRENLPQIIKGLRRFSKERFITPEEIEGKDVFEYGNILLGKLLFGEVLKDILTKHLHKKKNGFDEVVFCMAMILNRLVRPKSKLGILEWLEEVYLEDLKNEEFANLTLPTKVQRFYRSMDSLMESKEEIEKEIYFCLRDLFNLKVDVVFYDITSTYFEGEGPVLAERGYSRDNEPAKKQILLGLLMVKGLPIGHHVFKGNRPDKTTLKEVILDLKERFEIRQLIFVCDRGMVSEENLSFLEDEGYNYIVAIKRRRSIEAEEAINIQFKPEDEIKEGFFAKEASRKNGKRLIVCYNRERKDEEERKREKVMKELEDDLSSLKKRVDQGKLKMKKIVAKAEAILAKKHGKRYFTYETMRDGHFEYQRNEKSLLVEERLDGKYVLKTNREDLSVREIVESYKELAEIEDAFREIKDFIRLRPIYHHNDKRVRAHVFICCLAYLLEKILQKRLQLHGVKMSARKALENLKRIKVIENDVGGLTLKYVIQPRGENLKIFKALKIPHPPKILNFKLQ